MMPDILHRFHLPRRRRLSVASLSVIILLTIMVSYAIAWDRTKGNQRRLDKAVALLSRGRYEESLQLYNKVLKRWPRSRLALNGKGLCELFLGRYEDALASYDRLVVLDSLSVHGFDGKAMSYEKLGRYEEAIACYRRIEELSPGAMNAVGHIARLSRLESATR